MCRLYYVTLIVGRPAKAYYLDMDTGSDVTWLQCDAPCRSCGRVSHNPTVKFDPSCSAHLIETKGCMMMQGPHELYKPKKVSVHDCRHPLCAEIQAGGTYECEENEKGVWTHCYYERDYADGSSTMGIAMHDFIELPLSNGNSMQTIATFGY